MSKYVYIIHSDNVSRIYKMFDGGIMDKDIISQIEFIIINETKIENENYNEHIQKKETLAS